MDIQLACWVSLIMITSFKITVHSPNGYNDNRLKIVSKTRKRRTDIFANIYMRRHLLNYISYKSVLTTFKQFSTDTTIKCLEYISCFIVISSAIRVSVILEVASNVSMVYWHYPGVPWRKLIRPHHCLTRTKVTGHVASGFWNKKSLLPDCFLY